MSTSLLAPCRRPARAKTGVATVTTITWCAFSTCSTAGLPASLAILAIGVAAPPLLIALQGAAPRPVIVVSAHAAI